MATKLLPLLLLAHPSLGQTVTITQDIPFTGHDCVEDCLYRPYAAPIDLGDALECGPPYEEDCYCVTAAPQATIVSRHINDCASESCSRGDLTKDIESMKYYYAGYCVENGYTADLIEEWYSSAEVAETDSVTDEDAATTQTSEGETTATTATSTTEEEEESTSTEEASSTEETETVAASTRTSVVTQTAGSDEDEGGRGLPDFDFEGDDEDGASMSRGEMALLGLVPVVALLQWA